VQLTAHSVPVRPLAGLRVVVVDDDRVSLITITAMVGLWGAEIQSAASGRNALRLIMEEPPDLILSDLYMPDMDGFDLMKRVRELPPEKGGRTPGIAITAHPSFDSRRDADRAGYGAVFCKPFACNELIDTILRLAVPVPLSKS
jgi:CheY-like chemotaxis protein